MRGLDSLPPRGVGNHLSVIGEPRAGASLPEPSSDEHEGPASDGRAASTRARCGRLGARRGGGLLHLAALIRAA